jgi:S1-C subfamily serine protease
MVVLCLGLTTMFAAGACTDEPADVARASGSPSALPSGSSIVDVVARLQPSVVTIQTSDGLGSGVVYRSDGTIVTNAHVVGSARQVQVTFADGGKVSGQVKATDELTDVAVVTVGRTGLPAVPIRTELPASGETALALGCPLGFENSVT